MNWMRHVEAAVTDLTAALICNDDTAITHIYDAELNLEKAKSEWEERTEAEPE